MTRRVSPRAQIPASPQSKSERPAPARGHSCSSASIAVKNKRAVPQPPPKTTQRSLSVASPQRIVPDEPDDTHGYRNGRETVCEAVAIEEVARKHTDLEPLGGGGWFTPPCALPDHDDKGQSLYISPQGRERNGRRSALNFRTAKEVAEATPREIPWSVRPWLAKGAITEIDGPIKRAGKTTLVSHMVSCILNGQPFIGEPSAKSKAVWLTEQSATSFRKVLERAGLTDTEDLLILHWYDTIGAEWPEVAKVAADKAVEFGAEVLVVDTLGQFAGIRGDSENSAGAAQEAMQPLQEAAARDLAVVLTRHERKGGGEVGESARGSSAFGGAVDVIMSVRRHQGEARPTVRVIESLSRFDETPDKLVVELTDDGYRSLGDASAFAEREAISAIVELLPAKEENAMKT